MSTENETTERDRRSCAACRGTGRVISNLGGEAHDVRCPWCEGTGEFKAGHDAQEHISERAEPGASEHQRPENRE